MNFILKTLANKSMRYGLLPQSPNHAVN